MKSNLGIIIFSLSFTASGVMSQTVSESAAASKEFRTVSALVSNQTSNTYRLVRIGSNNAPAILTVNKSAITRRLSQTERSDISAVRAFAGNEARYIGSNALTLPTTATLEETATLKNGKTWLASFTVSYNGIPLRERFLRMDIGAISGEVMLVRNNIPAKKPNAISAKITPDNITSQTTNLLGSHSEIKSLPELIYIDERESTSLRLCYEVVATEPDMFEEWRMTFDAMTGELLEKKSLLEHECFSRIDPSPEFSENLDRARAACPYIQVPIIRENPLTGGSGMVLAKVHLHSPYDTLTTVGLPNALLTVNGVNIEADSTGFWSLPSATFPLNIQTSFNSPFLSILRQDTKPNSVLTKTITGSNADVVWDESNSDAAERDAYYSAAYAHLADKRIDEKLTGIDLHMKVNVNQNSVCNAFYIPSDTSINFFMAGSGCSNTAEISDVVFHEYGHRVTNAIYQMAARKNTNIFDGSLSEGFADLNSAFIRDDPRIGIGFFGNPDSNGGMIIRTCDNTKKWPHDISHDIHVSGEIVSGAFWDLREAIGHDTAEHLFHFMEYEMPDGPGYTDSASLEDAFASALTALILTDDDDNNLANGTPHLAQILAAFKLHNITLVKFLDLDPSNVEDQDTAANGYIVNVESSYNGIVGSLDTASLKIFYSFDNGKSFRSTQLIRDSYNEFSGTIPKVPAGTIVQYYTSAATIAGDTIVSPLPASAYRFLVGFKRIFFDNAEQDKGWSLSAATDTASKGLWIRGVPNGTFIYPYPPIEYIQQDTDHTPDGTMCYITGNHIDPSGKNLDSYDDVGNGATTLTTPTLDLSTSNSPYIRFWYYYSNDKGPFPWSAVWKTDISDDNGVTWHSLQSTNFSTNGPSGYPEWTQFSFRLKDYCAATSTVKIRFIASNYFGSLVEAGIDDLEILDQVTSESGVAISSPLVSSLPYPNPIRRGERLHLGANSSASLIDLLGRIIVPSVTNAESLTIPPTIVPGIYFIEQAGQKYKIVVF